MAETTDNIVCSENHKVARNVGGEETAKREKADYIDGTSGRAQNSGQHPVAVYDPEPLFHQGRVLHLTCPTCSGPVF